MMAAGWVALALAVVAVVTLAMLILFFTVGGAFGAMNDAGNALIGILAAVLAVGLLREAGGGAGAGAVAAIVGAAFALGGSWLVMSGSSGFVLAGFVSTIGFGCIGAWLALVAWGPMSDAWFGPLVGLARLTAAAMVVGGIVAIPAALMRIDAYEGMPGWVWLFSIGWVGVYLLLPIAMYGLGRRLLDA